LREKKKKEEVHAGESKRVEHQEEKSLLSGNREDRSEEACPERLLGEHEWKKSEKSSAKEPRRGNESVE
jgi:hypothetical protein